MPVAKKKSMKRADAKGRSVVKPSRSSLKDLDARAAAKVAGGRARTVQPPDH